ncbi:MAG TPA: YwiC-like family protein [Leptolyngbyaceae cyanobacterium M33_DOE_097]|uniref:YwiC-like family protein n=1 Tax=Oscillatoriales cyanobacterium SpSt-418 TaxID=2282169 RepID=A0A7C3PBR5_9CYAN|nr:YwiC-like family protein [Leptolyngbyaceae cyanobacterium M33_DOE_097]
MSISSTPNSSKPISEKGGQLPAWSRPTISPEHGVYVVLLVASLTGAAAAHRWTVATTLAMVCAFCGFQAEHPLVVQIRQRKSLKPRLLLWGCVYGGIAAAIALYLYWQARTMLSPLLWVYGGAIAALIFDGFSVLQREQKSILNEIVTFAAVCLAAPFVYISTTGHLSLEVVGLWLLNTLFFSSSIFTVKLRKLKQDEDLNSATQRLIVYHLIASLIVLSLYQFNILTLFTALTFGIGFIKVVGILWQRHWYCTTRIQNVALIETLSALLFCLATAISVLPAHLTGS